MEGPVASRSKIRHPYALGSAIGAGLIIFRLLYWVLAYNNEYIVQVYRSRSTFWTALYWIEQLLFFPTIWLTKPLAQIAQAAGLLGLMTFLEVCLLATFYAGLLYLAFSGQLSNFWNRRFGNRPWIPWLIAVILLVLSLSVPGGLPPSW